MSPKVMLTAAAVVLSLAPLLEPRAMAEDTALRGGAPGGTMLGGIAHREFHRPRAPRTGGATTNNFMWYSAPETVIEQPPAVSAPQPERTVLAVDRPPCRETTADGVVIVRGTACARTAE